MSISEFNIPISPEFATQLSQAMGIFAEFANESDRGVGILVGEILSANLEQLLRSIFQLKVQQDSPRVIDEAFTKNGPLATFSSKIQMCHLLGLIDSGEFRELNLHRQIRNDFAHNLSTMTFLAESVKHRVNEFRLEAIHGRILGEWDLPFELKATQPDKARFVRSGLVLCMLLIFRAERAKCGLIAMQDFVDRDILYNEGENIDLFIEIYSRSNNENACE